MTSKAEILSRVADLFTISGDTLSPGATVTPITTVNGLTGAVVVKGEDNNAATGISLIVDGGATTGLIKLKTIVAGSNVTLSADTNGNLEISASGSGGGGLSNDPFNFANVTVPTTGEFTYVAGSGNVATSGALGSGRGLYLASVNNGGSDNLATWRQAAPVASSWSMRGLISYMVGVGSYPLCGLFVSDGTKYVTWGYAKGNGGPGVTYYNTLVQWLSNKEVFNTGAKWQDVNWWRIDYNVTAGFLDFYMSQDGEQWIEYISLSATDQLTTAPTQVGFVINANGGPINAALFSFHAG